MALKLTTWNLEWFGQLLQGRERTLPSHAKEITSDAGKALQERERREIANEIRAVDPDILCIQEGPSTGRVELLRDFCKTYLDQTYTVVERGPNDDGGYGISGAQGIWFLVKSARLAMLSPRLLPIAAWQQATEYESRTVSGEPGAHRDRWTIIHPWFKPRPREREEDGHDGAGDPVPELLDGEHRHFRHPQTLVCMIGGKRVDLIGVHLKSKFAGRDFAAVGRLNQRPRDQLSESDVKRILAAEQKAVEARIKLTTECINIRYYIDNRFRNEPYPAIFLLGDMNDGVGREYFERKALFHDLLSNLQGDVFFARRFLNHALFDYRIDAETNYRWSVQFEDA